MDSQHSARVLATLVKREFSEQRLLFLYAPLAGAAAALLWFCIWLLSDEAARQAQSLVSLRTAFEKSPLSLRPGAEQRFWNQFGSVIFDARYLMAEQSMLMLFWASMAFYALYNLYRQRKDRSVLFWNSLPVSDAQIIASKLLAGPVLCYLWYLLCLAALDLGMYLVAVVHSVVTDNPLFDRFVQDPTLFGDVGEQLVRMPLTILWALPVFGWLLLASAWSKRAPFAWATGPWLLLIIIELALNDRSWLFDKIVTRLMPIEAVLVVVSDNFVALELVVSALLGFVFLLVAVRFNRSDEA